MLTVPRMMTRSYRALTLGALVIGLGTALWYAPVDEQMGVTQKLVYVHVPAAIASFLCAVGVFIGSIAFVWSRDDRWDVSARLAAQWTVNFSAIVLVTGMVWGHSFWGQWWLWTPRLTFTLLMFLVYLGYLLMRAAIGEAPRRRIAAAIYGLIAFLNVPFLYVSVRLLPDAHPTSIPLTAPMRITMLVCMVPIAMALVGWIARPWVRTLPTPRADRGARRAA